ncbi:MAG: hypothetical protein MK212_17190 [Saprospiraceae bacterium]|nr:hypothetical protein [Saprospiraceae bacterium]
MKKFNFIFILALLAGIGLSFTSVNNFTTTKTEFNVSDGNWMTNFYRQDLLDDNNKVSAEEVQKFLDENLVKPVFECMNEHSDLFMTKCYTRLTADLKSEDKEFDIRYTIEAELILTECSRPERMAVLRIDYLNKVIRVKESFRSPMVTHEEYVRDICAYYEENSTKIPFPSIEEEKEEDQDKK